MALQRTTIAVIDDDFGVRNGMDQLLTAQGYRVEAFASAEEFIAAAPTSEAACCLVDIQLGDISGVELGRHLTAIGLSFPIIFMTGSEDETLRRQAMDFGCIAYLTKPISVERLLEAIAQAVG